MANNQPSMSLGERFRLALDLITHDSRKMRVSEFSHKQEPYHWPEQRLEQPQWSPSNYGAQVSEGYNINSLIYSAVAYKMRTGIMAPLRAFEGEPDHPTPADPKHPLSALAKRPNKYLSGVQLQMLCDLYFNIAGECFVFLDRLRSTGLPEGMYPLRPDRVFIVPKKDGGAKGELLGYIYVPEGASPQDTKACVPMLPQDVLHVKYPRADDPLEGLGNGMSPLRAGGQSIDVDNEVTRFLKKFFQKGTMVHTYLKFDTPMDDDAVARARKRFMEIYGGADNWMGPAVVDQAGSIENFSMKFADMGFEAIDERDEARVVGPLGVPITLLGTRSGIRAMTQNNKELDRRMYWEDTRIPELQLFEESYQYYCQSDDGVFLAYDMSKVPALKKNVPQLVTAWKEMVSLGVPKHRAAEVVGLDLGKLPDGDKLYMPLNLVPLEENGNKPTYPSPSDAADPSSSQQDAQISEPDTSTEEAVDATRDTRKESTSEMFARMILALQLSRKESIK